MCKRRERGVCGNAWSRWSVTLHTYVHIPYVAKAIKPHRRRESSFARKDSWHSVRPPHTTTLLYFSLGKSTLLSFRMKVRSQHSTHLCLCTGARYYSIIHICKCVRFYICASIRAVCFPSVLRVCDKLEGDKRVPFPKRVVFHELMRIFLFIFTPPRLRCNICMYSYMS